MSKTKHQIALIWGIVYSAVGVGMLVLWLVGNIFLPPPSDGFNLWTMILVISVFSFSASGIFFLIGIIKYRRRDSNF